MSLPSRVRAAAVEAVLAGAAAGLFEGVRVASAAGSLGIVLMVAAVAMLGTIAGALVLRGGLAALVRVPPLHGWTADLAAGGGRRVVAVWRGVLVAAVLGTFGTGAFWLFEWMHEGFRFNDAGPIGLVYVCAVALLATASVLTALVVERRVRPRLPQALFDGARVWGLAAIAALLVTATPAVVVGRAVPALTLEPVLAGSVLLALVVAARVGRLGAYRALQIAALALVLGAGLGTWLLARSPAARGAIVAYGVASDQVAKLVRALADRDGDGYAGPAVGGADCDDADPGRHPGARDLAGNALDENCSGADADAMTFGLRTQSRPVPPVRARPNIVIVSIDALRADHLGAYGSARRISPALDALAAAGVRFASAFTSCPSTRCAIPALHTGRYASTLGRGPEREAIPSLARVLRDHGYTTAAITCCARFAQAKDELAGFTTIDASADTMRMQRAGQSNADVVVDHTLGWLRGVDPARPYFAWLHLYEPHFPYNAPGGPDLGDDELDRYDREIAFADAQLARLFAALDPSAIVVVTSDHGEEFGEHGLRFHARSLYNQVVRIPLIIRLPGVAPRVVETPVSLVDVMPTLLELAGVEGPVGMNGRSLVPALRGGSAPVRPVLIELAHDHQIKRDMAAVVSAPWKVIWDREANAWSVYALDDVADVRDRAGDAPLGELQRVLQGTLDRELGAWR